MLAGLGLHVLSFDLLGDVVIASSGMVLMWPMTSHPRPADLPRVWELINATSDDALAPFTMQTGKSYHFTADGSAALAYRTRMGIAVVSGDPIGDETHFPELVADFAATCHAHGWRIAVVGCESGGSNSGATRRHWDKRCGPYRLGATWWSTCRASTWWAASSATCVRP